MPTGLQIVTGALQEIGVVAAGQVAEGSEGTDALSILNDFLDALGVDRLAMHAVVRTVKALVSGTASYTIGTGGDISLVRPMWIESAMLIADTGATTLQEYPLDVLTDQQYAAWPEKALQQSQSRAIWFDHVWTAGLGRVYPLPIPDVSTTSLVLYTPTEPISQIATLETSVTFPPGIRRMLRKNLALELAPSYPAASVTPLLISQAAESKAKWKQANVRPRNQACDNALLPNTGYWDIETGRYR